MTRDLEYPLEISLSDGEPTRARGMDVIHDMVRLTAIGLSVIVTLGRSEFTHQARIV